MNNELPSDFNWEVYLKLNNDLIESGIKTEKESIEHFLNSGINEKRIYKLKTVEINQKFENSSVFICGTSPEVSILEDKNILNKIENDFLVLCVNSSFHYFDKIDCLFLNGRFSNIDISNFNNKRINKIFIPFINEKFNTFDTSFFCLKISLMKFYEEISSDLNSCLPHGPTTLLDIVFPFCVFNKVKKIYLFGFEYPTNPDKYERHSNEKLYIDRSEIVMDRNKELEFAQKKLKIWNEFFIKNDIECFDLSNLSNTPFQKEKLNHVLTAFS